MEIVVADQPKKTLRARFIRWMFDLLWYIDHIEVINCIEDAEYIHMDDAYDYICQNMWG